MLKKQREAVIQRLGQFKETEKLLVRNWGSVKEAEASC